MRIPTTEGFAFQPTLPVRGATIQLAQISQNTADFNPRSPCGERHYTINNAEVVQTFQPTLPVRGATRKGFYLAV